MATMRQIKRELKRTKVYSAWDKGVLEYAWELIDNVEQSHNYLGLRDNDTIGIQILKKSMLNGADSWHDYSWGGCSLIYDTDIAEVLCTPSELKKTDGGRRKPNKYESWLDVQARALFQASNLIIGIANRINGGV